ncbi:MAG: MATE family efflux transporter [Turicibacter sp.]|nr:MATE family efflux transporter [Turicibacter sp.]
MNVNSELLGKEQVHKLIIKFGSFAIITMLATGAVNVIGTLIVSRGIDVYAVGAIGLLFPLITVYFGFSQLVAIGAASYISRMLGAGKKKQALSATAIAYVLTLLISLCLMVGTWLFKEHILTFLGATGQAKVLARAYLNLFVFSIPFTAMVLLASAIFRAYGKIKLSMLVILVESGLIIALDYLFIFVLGAGISSVALSHLIAGSFAAILGMALLLQIGGGEQALTFDLTIIKGLLSIGISALGRSLASATFALVLNRMINQLGGDDPIAALGTVNRIVLFLTFAIMGISQAMQPIVSYNFTAKKSTRVKDALKYGLIYSSLIGLSGSLLGIFFPNQVVGIFTNNAEVLDDAALIFNMQLAVFFSFGLQTLAATYFQAIGKAWMSFFLSVFKPLFILVPLVYLLPRYLDADVSSVWWAFPISDVVATVICLLILRRAVKQMPQQLAEKPQWHLFR